VVEIRISLKIPEESSFSFTNSSILNKSNISKNYIVSAKAAKALWYCCTTPNSLDPVGAWRDFNVQFFSDSSKYHSIF
jgi:hypothetical protein